MSKLVFMVSLFVAALVASLLILTNVAFVHSPILGAVASVLYVVLTGFQLGKAFLSDVDEVFSGCVFGIFFLISVFLIVGTPIVIFYNLNFLGLAVILSAPLVLLGLSLILLRRKYGEAGATGKKVDKLAYLSPVYVIFFILIGYCTFLLVEARSGWIVGTVWDVVSPSLFPAYFLAAFTLVGIILYSRTKPVSKVFLVIVFGLLSYLIMAIVLFPDNGGDAGTHLAGARIIFDYGSLRYILYRREITLWHYYWLIKERGLMLLSALLAKMFMVDVYWVHTFVPPMIWAVFAPLTAYKIVRMTGGGERVSVMAALPMTFYTYFLIWGSISTANSLAYVFFLVSLCFSMRYLKSKGIMAFLLAGISVLSCALAHPFPGAMAFAFLVLAVAWNKYEVTKVRASLRAHLFILISFIACIFILIFMTSLQNVVYLVYGYEALREAYAVVAFDFGRLLKTDLWELVFGEFINFTFKEAVLYEAFFFLGVLGLIFAFKEKNKYERVLTSFLILSLLITLIDHRIMRYAMTNIPFGPGRILHIGNLIVIPFAAVAIVSVVRFLEGKAVGKTRSMSAVKSSVTKLRFRQVCALMLIGLSFSGLAASSTHFSYQQLLKGGLQPTQLAVDAVKYIDEHTDGRYVVITVPHMSTAGEAWVGISNPEKYYVYSWELGNHPSLVDMESHMRRFEATVGYFAALSFATPNFNSTVAEASRIFDLFKTLTNEHGQICIFRYKVPPLPVGPDVVAFYWDTPPTYIIQNDLMRVVFNPEYRYLDVRDFWGDLYESIDLNGTLVDGEPLGSLTSVKYYDPSSSDWVEWTPDWEIPSIPALAEQFKFKFEFENESLIGMVEKDNSSVQLWWEAPRASTLSLEVGEFSRLYIPSLIRGVNSYDVISRKFGLFYTIRRTNDITIHPANRPEIGGSFLIFDEIKNYCKLNITEGYFWYDLNVNNNAKVDQWACLEVWLPDKISGGITPSISHSVDDGKTWSTGPIKTLGGVDVNWVVSFPENLKEKPTAWRRITEAAGGSFGLPGNFTDSGGGQNKIIYALYLPAEDRALVRLSASIYGCHPLKITYIFEDSGDVSYGLRNMNPSLIKLYNYEASSYVGGLELTMKPTSLFIIQDETRRISYMQATIPPVTIFSLLSNKDVDTTIDEDEDGIPDLI